MLSKVFWKAILCAIWLAAPATAGTVTDTFDVTLTIQAGCEVSAPDNLNFGTATFLDSILTGTVQFSVRCTSGTDGTISLNGGIGSSGTVATRTMESGANSINYSLYMDAGYATIWGDGTSGTSTYPHSGTGSTTALTIHGLVPIQTTPTAATYSDTITITVTY
jgi:spore coat protein U-like protein